MATEVALPNPFTPLAFLPPEIAYQNTVSNYIIVGALGVHIWDLLNNLSSDFRLIFVNKIRLATVAYFLSRIGTLGFALVSAIFATAPVGTNNCVPWEKAANTFYPIAVAATSLLFFLRIRAVFNRNQSVIVVFFLLWLGVLGANLAVIPAVSGGSIGPTNYCIITDIKAYVSASIITALVHDTLVFLAISWRLAQNTWTDRNGPSPRWKALMFGESLPSLSRAVLQDGQKYYLATIGSGLLVVMMVYVPGIPTVYRTMFTIPNTVLTNIMACRVFRHTRDTLRKGTTSEISRLDISKDDKSGPAIPLSLSRTTPRSRDEFGSTLGDENEAGNVTTKASNRVHDYTLPAEDKPRLSQDRPDSRPTYAY